MPWLIVFATLILATTTGITTISQGQFWRRRAGKIVTVVLSVSCYVCIGVGFWKFGVVVGLVEILVFFAGVNIGDWILRRLGIMVPLVEQQPIDPELMAKELWSGESARRRERENEVAEADIGRALNEPAVQKVMRDTGLTEDEIRNIHRVVWMYGDLRRAAQAVRQLELLRWYHAKAATKTLNMNTELSLSLFARSGQLPVE